MAVFGGSIGAWLGMRVFHHKTMHKKFNIGVPTIIILQIALALPTIVLRNRYTSPFPQSIGICVQKGTQDVFDLVE